MTYFQLLLKHSHKNEKIPQLSFHHKKNNPQIKKLYNYLPLQCSLSQEEIALAQALPSWIWNLKYPYDPSHWKEEKEPHYHNYHKLVHSVAPRILKKALEDAVFKTNVNHPVIHYRLGDVPFCRNSVHHLNRYSFFLWALEKNTEDNTVIIVTSNKHRSKPKMKQASLSYLQDFIHFLKENGYHPIIQSKSIVEDFATMVFAPVLISGGSTYSFMAGMANNQTFVSSLIGQEKGQFFDTIENCDWMYPHLPILHRDIASYYDMETVFEKLREPEAID